MKVTREVVSAMSELAQIKVPEDQVDEVISRLDAVLALVETMAQVDTEGVEPLTNPLDATQPLRADVPTEENRRNAYLDIAPASEDGLFLVPRVVE